MSTVVDFEILIWSRKNQYFNLSQFDLKSNSTLIYPTTCTNNRFCYWYVICIFLCCAMFVAVGVVLHFRQHFIFCLEVRRMRMQTSGRKFDVLEVIRCPMCNGFWWSLVTNRPFILLITTQWETGGIALQLFLIQDVHHTPTSLQLCLLYIEHILIYEEEQ